MCCLVLNNHDRGFNLAKMSSRFCQIPVRGHVSGENRCHQSQDHGQEAFHHQNGPGWRHNPETEKLCGRRGGRHSRHRQQGKGLEDQDDYSAELRKGLSAFNSWQPVALTQTRRFVHLWRLTYDTFVAHCEKKHDCETVLCKRKVWGVKSVSVWTTRGQQWYISPESHLKAVLSFDPFCTF